MAVPAFKTLTENTTTILEGVYTDLVRQSEQLRILKNYAELEEVLTKREIVTLLKAMEGGNE